MKAKAIGKSKNQAEKKRGEKKKNQVEKSCLMGNEC